MTSLTSQPDMSASGEGRVALHAQRAPVTVFHGAPGSGKTTAVLAELQKIPGRTVVVTAPTVEAVEGVLRTRLTKEKLPWMCITFSMLYMALQNLLQSKKFGSKSSKSVSLNRDPRFMAIKSKLKLGRVMLWIDEVTQVDGRQISMLDDMMQKLAENTAPFGGNAVVMSGDPYQISCPPPSISLFHHTHFRQLCNDGKVHTVFLDKCHRFTGKGGESLEHLIEEFMSHGTTEHILRTVRTPSLRSPVAHPGFHNDPPVACCIRCPCARKLCIKLTR